MAIPRPVCVEGPQVGEEADRAIVGSLTRTCRTATSFWLLDCWWPPDTTASYLRSEAFERIVRAIDAVVTAAGANLQAPAFHFPLVMSNGLLERTDYVRSFPDCSVRSTRSLEESADAALLDAVEAGEDWSGFPPTGLALCSAASTPSIRLSRARYPRAVAPSRSSVSASATSPAWIRPHAGVPPARVSST